jgi:hypothetical protein
MNIRLHIERLIVDGLPLSPREQRRLRATVETRLGALLAAAPPAGISGYSVPALPVAPIAWGSDNTGVTAGDRIARSLHSALAPQAHLDRRSR